MTSAATWLDEGETDEISGEMTTNLIEKVLPTDGG
jgi:hypothetical protein